MSDRSEKDKKRDDLLERAMEVVKMVDDFSWMPTDIMHGLRNVDGKSPETAYVTIGRLFERVEAVRYKVPDLIVGYQKLQCEEAFENLPNLSKHEKIVRDFKWSERGCVDVDGKKLKIENPAYPYAYSWNRPMDDWYDCMNKRVVHELIKKKRGRPTGSKTKKKTVKPRKTVKPAIET